jgi:DAK2 domain fusion protein YloV
MLRFTDALREHRDELNSLNVYPVPDGDTGTNMLLTQEAVWKELENVPDGDLAALGEAIAKASLMGARGNSGVILAQALRGFCDEVCRDSSADAAGVARGLKAASAEAHRAVARPAEGTVLTVLADAAEAAAEAAERSADLAVVADAALEAGRLSLERTRDTLPELRAADVVDAGAKGIVLLLDSLAATVSRGDPSIPVGPLGPAAHEEASGNGGVRELDFPFEVVYLLDAPDEAISSLRRDLSRLGDSVVVVGGEGMFKVHVHTTAPDQVVELGEEVGRPKQVEVVDLREQVAAYCLAGEARSVRVAEEHPLALVAVADGEGLAEIFRSLGARVVRGGPGNNPSVGELLDAIDVAPAAAVVVLPNHANVVPAAERAAAQSSKAVTVIPSQSLPQGVAAAAAFHPAEEMAKNADRMLEALQSSAAGEISVAARDADTPARPGEYLATTAGAVVQTGADAALLSVDLVRRLKTPNHELVTVYVGSDASEDEAGAVERALKDAFPDLEVEIHRGGQPGSPYLIGVE